MIPAAFGYQRPATVDEALKAISGGDGSVKVLAGGQSLLPLLKLRLGRADTLVDIGRLDELKGVRQLPDGRLAVGASLRYRSRSYPHLSGQVFHGRDGGRSTGRA